MAKSNASLNLRAISNTDLWAAVRAKYPTFASHTSEGTSQFMSERGFDAFATNEVATLNEFFELLNRVYLQMIQTARARDPLENAGFGEYYSDEYGEIAQRIAIHSVKPISPAYRNLEDGDSPDPFVVRKPTTTERFFRPNFDYQSLITIPDRWTVKRMFLEETGISSFMAGIMDALQNGYTKQLYLNKLEALNALLNSTAYPLQSTQQFTVNLSATPTEGELRTFLYSILNVLSLFDIGASYSAYNAAGFETVQDKDRLVMLIRPGIMNAMKTYLWANTYQLDQLQFPVKFVEVENFGGLTPVVPGTTTPVYPVYNTLGEQIGFAATEGATTPIYRTSDDPGSTLPDVDYIDPNANTIAVLADRGAVFYTQHNPYTVAPIYNPRGLYTNYWASSPNNGVNADPYFTVMEFVNAGPADPTAQNVFITNDPLVTSTQA